MNKLFISVLFLIITILVYTPETKAENIPSATVYYNQGIDFYNGNEIQNAINAFKKAIGIDPKFYEAYYNLAKIQESYSYYNDAIATYEKLIEIMPEDYESIYNLGNLLYKRGYLRKSLTYLDRIPSYSEKYTEAQKLTEIVEKRQVEVAEEMRLKDVTAKKSSLFQNVQAPSGVAVDAHGNVYIASFSQNAVYKIDQNNNKTTFAGSNTLGGPIGVAVDEKDNIYVANYTKNNIVKVSPDGKTKVLLLVKKPYCLNVDNNNKKLLITEQDKNTVIKFDLTGEI